MATRAHGRAREAQPHMDVRLHRLPKDWFLVVQVLWTSYAWSPEYLPRADTSWRQSKLCQDSLINTCLFRETRRIWFQSFFITLSAVTQALNINANKKTPLQKERPYDDYFPLCFSSQYLQRYTSFSSSVRIKIWVELLLDRCDTSWILAGDDILNLTWKCQLFLVDNFIALNDIDGNVVIDIT